MKTLYLDGVRLSIPKKRPPLLRIRILESLVMTGELSKSSARHYLKKVYNEEHQFPEISEAFDALNDNGLIQNAYCKQGRGKPEVFYKVSEQGLACIIAENPTPKRFWSLLIGFCYHRGDPVGLDIVNAYYEFFLSKYLKYSSRMSYLFELDSFNKMCVCWFQKNVANQKTEEPPLAQRVLELLGLSPRISLHEIASNTRGSVEQVNKVLELHTMKVSYYTDIYHTSEEEYLDRLPEQYTDFLQRCTVIDRHDSTGKDTYELSLFGIGLLMYLIRQRTMGRLKLFFDIPLEEYYEKIASNYADSLPLIFGKWSILRKYLKSWSVYNFDIILVEEQVRSRVMEIPIISGGLKELYQDMHSILFSISRQLADLFQTGLDAFNHFRSSRIEYLLTTETKPRKTEDTGSVGKAIAIHQKLEQMKALSRYADPVQYQEELFEEAHKRYLNNTKSRNVLTTETDDSHPSPVIVLQEAFAEEITFVYYLNLFFDGYIPVMPANHGSYAMWSESINELIMNPSSRNTSTSSNPLPLSPKKRLMKILSKDPDIKKTLSAWINDVSNYHEEVQRLLSTIYYPNK